MRARRYRLALLRSQLPSYHELPAPRSRSPHECGHASHRGAGFRTRSIPAVPSRDGRDRRPARRACSRGSSGGAPAREVWGEAVWPLRRGQRAAPLLPPEPPARSLHPPRMFRRRSHRQARRAPARTPDHCSSVRGRRKVASRGEPQAFRRWSHRRPSAEWLAHTHPHRRLQLPLARHILAWALLRLSVPEKGSASAREDISPRTRHDLRSCEVSCQADRLVHCRSESSAPWTSRVAANAILRPRTASLSCRHAWAASGMPGRPPSHCHQHPDCAVLWLES
mmetsp:Transcript_38150/g.100104  ORF Transcript_38150/g.100104 Transcript_38150/m.100104 type:complete len:281 (+) Transcript_38150:702-1544(+)